MTTTYDELANQHSFKRTLGAPIQLEATDVHDIIGDRRDMWFVHPQKMGGHSVMGLEKNPIGKFKFRCSTHGWMFTPKTSSSYYVEILKGDKSKYVVYSHTRNPYDWLVSFYFHYPHGVGYVAESCKSFKAFILDIHNSNSKCDYFQPTRSAIGEARWPMRYLQSWQTFEPLSSNTAKRSLADFYIRCERMNEAYSEIFDIDIAHTNKTAGKKKDYRYHWDNEMIDIIEEKRAQELHLLGYDFNGPLDDAYAIKVTGTYKFMNGRQR